MAALINQKTNFTDGIRFAQDEIDGTASILILKDDGKIIAARRQTRKASGSFAGNDEGYCVSFETFAYEKLGYSPIRELGPGEIIEFDGENVKVLEAPHKEMRVCSFLWTYYGYPTSSYEGVNVETMRYRNGAEMAKNDEESGTLPQLGLCRRSPGFRNTSRYRIREL